MPTLTTPRGLVRLTPIRVSARTSISLRENALYGFQSTEIRPSPTNSIAVGVEHGAGVGR